MEDTAPVQITSVALAMDPGSDQYKALRNEYDEINFAIRAHNDGRAELPDYQAKLRRSLEILYQLNSTTAGPKKSPTKKVAANTPKVLSLDDI